MEMMVVVAAVAVVVGMTFAVARRQKQQWQASTTIQDVRGLLAQARAAALSSGRDVAVLVFPDQVTGDGGRGRFVVYRDTAGTFFNATAPINFDGWDPAVYAGYPAGVPEGDLLDVVDLALGVHVGPTTGQGTGKALPAPIAVRLDADCTFCSTATPRRGAVVFDYAGRARFYSGNGTPLVTGTSGIGPGGSVSLISDLEPGEVRSVAVTAASGALQILNYKLP